MVGVSEGKGTISLSRYFFLESIPNQKNEKYKREKRILKTSKDWQGKNLGHDIKIEILRKKPGLDIEIKAGQKLISVNPVLLIFESSIIYTYQIFR